MNRWMNEWIELYVTFVHKQAKIRALVVWGLPRYLSVTQTPHNTGSLQNSGEVSFEPECQRGGGGGRTRASPLFKQAA